MAPMLRNAQRIRVFEPRKTGALFPTEPVVGEEVVVLGEDNKCLAALDRANLALLWRARVSNLGPAAWSGSDFLMLQGETAVGVWDVPGKRLLWRAKVQLGLGGDRWGECIATWTTRNKIELRDMKSGQVTATIKVPAPAVATATRCGNLLVCTSVGAGDPVRAVRLDAGVVVWDLNLLEELDRTDGIDASRTLVVRPGSMPDRFVATRGSATLACSLADGSILWRADVRVPYYWPLVERGQIPVYSDLDTRFVVIDEVTGKLVCDRRYPELRPMYHVKRGSILGDLAIFVSESGHVAAFRLDNGDLAFLEQNKRVAFWGTAVVDGRLLVSGSDGELWVYEQATR